MLLDTTAVSEIMRRDANHLQRLQSLEPRQVVLCAPVAAEIRFGLERLDPDSRRRKLLEQEYRRLREVVSWEDWSEQAAEVFGVLKATLRHDGTPVDDMDLVIASIALSCGAIVATSNRRHFDRVPKLQAVQW